MVSSLNPRGTGIVPEVGLAADPSIERARLAAIVDSSDDAILTKDLDGIITTWNRGAERIFGYTAEEAVGQSVTMLIPPDRHDEEAGILGRIRRGEHVDHYETIRQHKDGRLLHISLSVSPLRDDRGRIVGASKIARDISERFRAEEQQRLLLAEMQHRIKNVFAVANGLIRLCASRAETPAELAEMARSRLTALASAHALTVPVGGADGSDGAKQATLRDLVRTLVAPVVGEDGGRVLYDGDDCPLLPGTITPIALVLNELVTNATKHGALREPSGTVQVGCEVADDRVVVTWEEWTTGCPTSPPETSGFGTHISQMTVEHQLGGTIVREWRETGLSVTIEFAADQLQAPASAA